MKTKILIALLPLITIDVAHSYSYVVGHNSFKCNHFGGMFTGAALNNDTDYYILARPGYPDHIKEMAYCAHSLAFLLETTAQKKPAQITKETQEERAKAAAVDLIDLNVDIASTVDREYVDGKITKWNNWYGKLSTAPITKEEREYWEGINGQIKLQYKVMKQARITNQQRLEIGCQIGEDVDAYIAEIADFYADVTARAYYYNSIYNIGEDYTKLTRSERFKDVALYRMTRWNLAAYDISTEYGNSNMPVNRQWSQGWDAVDDLSSWETIKGEFGIKLGD